MGREIRKVPADWQHPKNEHGNYIPLFDGFNESLKDWDEGARQWDAGYMEDFRFFPESNDRHWKPKPDEPEYQISYAEWAGPRPRKEEYMPDWPEEERTHIQMYENTTEGTPISPVMSCPRELARWLADNNASAFGSMTASYDDWLAMIENQGFSVSMVSTPEGIQSGVQASAGGK
jgi:hypothetical protein